MLFLESHLNTIRPLRQPKSHSRGVDFLSWILKSKATCLKSSDNKQIKSWSKYYRFQKKMIKLKLLLLFCDHKSKIKSLAIKQNNKENLPVVFCSFNILYSSTTFLSIFSSTKGHKSKPTRNDPKTNINQLYLYLAVLVVNKRNVTSKSKTCTQLCQLII